MKDICPEAFMVIVHIRFVLSEFKIIFHFFFVTSEWKDGKSDRVALGNEE